MVSEPSGANETRSYSCNFCNKTFKTFKLLADHKSRSLHNHFYCRRCNLDFSTAMERQQHFDSPIATVGFEPNGQVRCEPCKRYFSSMTVLSTHLHCYHKYLCTECLLDFHNPGALNQHRASKHFITNQPLPAPQSTEVDGVQSSSSDPSSSSAETDRQLPTTPSPEEVPQEVCPTAHESTTENIVVEQEGDEASMDGLQPPAPMAAPYRPRHPFWCRVCRRPFSSEDTLRQHLDSSSSVIPHARMPGGGFRCFVCLRLFHSLNGFKRHLSYLDRRHEAMLAKWCIPCLLQFHTHNGLQKHIDDVHAPQASQEAQQGTAPSNETESLLTQVAAIALDSSESEMLPIQASSPVQPELSPVDRLFASISFLSNLSPQETGTVETSSPRSSQTPLPQEDPQSSVVSADTSPLTVAQTPAPSVVQTPAPSVVQTPAPSLAQAPSPSLLNPPETIDVPSSPPLVSTSLPSQSALPAQPAHPPRPDSLFCRKCKLAFTNYEEQKDHLRNGMSAIRAQNDDGSLVCAQCNRIFANMRAMKGHLSRSHDMTCVRCLLYFHTSWAIRAHRQSLHTTNAGSGDDPLLEQPQSQPSLVPHPPSEPRPASPPPEPSERPVPPAPHEVRPVIRGSQSAPRNHRTVRQISLQDFSDTDEDDPADIENSQLGGWQESGPQGQRRPDANAYSVRTGGNVSGRNSRPGGRRVAEEQRWWWEGQPPATSWDALASGRIPQGPHPIELATSSKSASINPKAPRISSVAVPCCVCLEEAAVDLTATPCGHAGCETCLRTAVKTKPECPICRKPTRPSDLRPLFL